MVYLYFFLITNKLVLNHNYLNQNYFSILFQALLTVGGGMGVEGGWIGLVAGMREKVIL